MNNPIRSWLDRRRRRNEQKREESNWFWEAIEVRALDDPQILNWGEITGPGMPLPSERVSK